MTNGSNRVCWLCGRSGAALDRHHIFGGSNRAKSERYGLVVLLCHDSCHIFGKNAVHQNADTMQMLHEYGQQLAMQKYGWSISEFRSLFGKNYLEGTDDEHTVQPRL
jgi:hypothetical protein